MVWPAHANRRTRRDIRQAKGAVPQGKTLGPKRYASRSRGAMEPCRRQSARRRSRRGLTHRGMCAERGKPELLPQGKASREASPWECGYRIAEEANAVL